jgi:hypothetical protein
MYADVPTGAGQFARQDKTVATVVAGTGADQHATMAEMRLDEFRCRTAGAFHQCRRGSGMFNFDGAQFGGAKQGE